MLVWSARYDDGTELPQYNENGSDNKYTDIDRTKLVKFALIDEDGNVKYAIHIDPAKNQRLIYRMRTVQENQIIATGDSKVVMGPTVNKERVHILGWQMLVAGQNVQVVAFVFENGAVEITNGFQEGNALMKSVIFLPEEEL